MPKICQTVMGQKSHPKQALSIAAKLKYSLMALKRSRYLIFDRNSCFVSFRYFALCQLISQCY